MLLVVLVIFVFLQSWRATIIPLLAVPVSLIGTFGTFVLLDFSINTLTLFAWCSPSVSSSMMPSSLLRT